MIDALHGRQNISLFVLSLSSLFSIVVIVMLPKLNSNINGIETVQNQSKSTNVKCQLIFSPFHLCWTLFFFGRIVCKIISIMENYSCMLFASFLSLLHPVTDIPPHSLTLSLSSSLLFSLPLLLFHSLTVKEKKLALFYSCSIVENVVVCFACLLTDFVWKCFYLK